MTETYFNKLNYTLANEDTSLELAILKEGVGHVMAVCGSGGRVLPLLARSPEQLTIIDLSSEQLWLAELRLKSAALLKHDEFLRFWGYPPEDCSPTERQRMFKEIDLSAGAREFLAELFQQEAWQSILYLGKWERTFTRLATVARFFTREAGLGIFECRQLEEQVAYFHEKFPLQRWHALVGILGNASVFNAMLYKGHFPRKNIPQTFFSFYRAAFEHLFLTGLARENFFLQILFHGRIIHAEGNPIECQPEVYALLKDGLSRARIQYVKTDIIKAAAEAVQPVDFLSLSDVPSYFSGDLEKSFLSRAAPGLAPGALAIIRSYQRVPWRPMLVGYENVTELFAEPIAREKTQMYLVDIYRKLL